VFRIVTLAEGAIFPAASYFVSPFRARQHGAGTSPRWSSLMRKLLLSVVLSLVAVTTAAAQSVTGEWDGAMNTPGGARPVRVFLKQDGEKLTGTVKRESGDVALQGTIVGTTVKFAYSIAYGGNPITLTVNATVAGDQMTGQVDIAGQVQEAFTAKRVSTTVPPAAGPPPRD
jgi:hypothetical protein